MSEHSTPSGRGRGRSRTSYRTTPSPDANSGSQYFSPDSTPVVQSTQFNLQSPPPPPPSQPFAPMPHQFPYPGTTMPPWGYYGVPPTFYPPDVVPPSGQYVGGTSHMPDRHSPYTFMPTPQGLNSLSASAQHSEPIPTDPEKYERLSAEASSSSASIGESSSPTVNEHDIFYQAVSGRNRKGRIYGLGSQANLLYPSTTNRSSQSSSHMSPEFEQMKLKVTQLTDELLESRAENRQLRQWQEQVTAWQSEMNIVISRLTKQSTADAGPSTVPGGSDPVADQDESDNDEDENANNNED
ncbi:formin-like protein 7 [Diospyros lotus]|uniref:formin-like protein 7 n=1 Tax=Diospyros lotus TaxID=55363 RepID=UPI0022551B44|nr:formin-like protein 7 [Diospyros lotus]